MLTILIAVVLAAPAWAGEFLAPVSDTSVRHLLGESWVTGVLLALGIGVLGMWVGWRDRLRRVFEEPSSKPQAGSPSTWRDPHVTRRRFIGLAIGLVELFRKPMGPPPVAKEVSVRSEVDALMRALYREQELLMVIDRLHVAHDVQTLSEALTAADRLVQTYPESAPLLARRLDKTLAVMEENAKLSAHLTGEGNYAEALRSYLRTRLINLLNQRIAQLQARDDDVQPSSAPDAPAGMSSPAVGSVENLNRVSEEQVDGPTSLGGRGLAGGGDVTRFVTLLTFVGLGMAVGFGAAGRGWLVNLLGLALLVVALGLGMVGMVSGGGALTSTVSRGVRAGAGQSGKNILQKAHFNTGELNRNRFLAWRGERQRYGRQLIQELGRIVRLPELALLFQRFEFRNTALHLSSQVLSPLWLSHRSSRDEHRPSASKRRHDDGQVATSVGLTQDQISATAGAQRVWTNSAHVVRFFRIDTMLRQMLHSLIGPDQLPHAHFLSVSERRWPVKARLVAAILVVALLAAAPAGAQTATALEPSLFSDVVERLAQQRAQYGALWFWVTMVFSVLPFAISTFAASLWIWLRSLQERLRIDQAFRDHQLKSAQKDFGALIPGDAALSVILKEFGERMLSSPAANQFWTEAWGAAAKPRRVGVVAAAMVGILAFLMFWWAVLFIAPWAYPLAWGILLLDIPIVWLTARAIHKRLDRFAREKLPDLQGWLVPLLTSIAWLAAAPAAAQTLTYELRHGTLHFVIVGLLLLALAGLLGWFVFRPHRPAKPSTAATDSGPVNDQRGSVDWDRGLVPVVALGIGGVIAWLTREAFGPWSLLAGLLVWVAVTVGWWLGRNGGSLRSWFLPLVLVPIIIGLAAAQARVAGLLSPVSDTGVRHLFEVMVAQGGSWVQVAWAALSQSPMLGLGLTALGLAMVGMVSSGELPTETRALLNTALRGDVFEKSSALYQLQLQVPRLSEAQLAEVLGPLIQQLPHRHEHRYSLLSTIVTLIGEMPDEQRKEDAALAVLQHAGDLESARQWVADLVQELSSPRVRALLKTLYDAGYEPSMGVPSFRASIRLPPGAKSLKAGTGRVSLFEGRIRTVPYEKISEISGVQSSEILAIFPSARERAWLRSLGLRVPSGHVFDALAYARFHVQGRSLVVTSIQSDAYRILRRHEAAKKHYADWRNEMRLCLELYARWLGCDQIISPPSEAIRERWPLMNTTLARLIYDQGLGQLGFVLEELAEPMPWEANLVLTKAWVKRLDATLDPWTREFQEVFSIEPAAGRFFGNPPSAQGGQWRIFKPFYNLVERGIAKVFSARVGAIVGQAVLPTVLESVGLVWYGSLWLAPWVMPWIAWAFGMPETLGPPLELLSRFIVMATLQLLWHLPHLSWRDFRSGRWRPAFTRDTNTIMAFTLAPLAGIAFALTSAGVGPLALSVNLLLLGIVSLPHLLVNLFRWAQRSFYVWLAHEIAESAQHGTARSHIDAERRLTRLLIRIGALPKPDEGTVVSLLNGGEMVLFEQVSGVGHDLGYPGFPQDLPTTVASALSTQASVSLNVDAVSRNYRGTVRVPFASTAQLADNIARLLPNQRPRTFILKHAEECFWMLYQVSPENQGPDKGLAVEQAYEEALRRFEREVMPPGSTIVVIEAPLRGDWHTGRILEELGYQDVLPDLLPAEALQHVKSLEETHLSVPVHGDQLRLIFGGRVRVFRKPDAVTPTPHVRDRVLRVFLIAGLTFLAAAPAGAQGGLRTPKSDAWHPREVSVVAREVGDVVRVKEGKDQGIVGEQAEFVTQAPGFLQRLRDDGQEADAKRSQAFEGDLAASQRPDELRVRLEERGGIPQRSAEPLRSLQGHEPVMHVSQDSEGGDRLEIVATRPFQHQRAAGVGAGKVVDKTVGVHEEGGAGRDVGQLHGLGRVEEGELGRLSRPPRQPFGDANDAKRRQHRTGMTGEFDLEAQPGLIAQGQPPAQLERRQEPDRAIDIDARHRLLHADSTITHVAVAVKQRWPRSCSWPRWPRLLTIAMLLVLLTAAPAGAAGLFQSVSDTFDPKSVRHLLDGTWVTAVLTALGLAAVGMVSSGEGREKRLRNAVLRHIERHHVEPIELIVRKFQEGYQVVILGEDHSPVQMHFAAQAMRAAAKRGRRNVKPIAFDPRIPLGQTGESDEAMAEFIIAKSLTRHPSAHVLVYTGEGHALTSLEGEGRLGGFLKEKLGPGKVYRIRLSLPQSVYELRPILEGTQWASTSFAIDRLPATPLGSLLEFPDFLYRTPGEAALRRFDGLIVLVPESTPAKLGSQPPPEGPQGPASLPALLAFPFLGLSMASLSSMQDWVINIFQQFADFALPIFLGLGLLGLLLGLAAPFGGGPGRGGAGGSGGRGAGGLRPLLMRLGQWTSRTRSSIEAELHQVRSGDERWFEVVDGRSELWLPWRQSRAPPARGR